MDIYMTKLCIGYLFTGRGGQNLFEKDAYERFTHVSYRTAP